MQFARHHINLHHCAWTTSNDYFWVLHRGSPRRAWVCMRVPMPQLANSYAVIWIAVSSLWMGRLSCAPSIWLAWLAWFAAAFVLSCSFKLFDCRNQVYTPHPSRSPHLPDANGALNHGIPPTPHTHAAHTYWGTKAAAYRQVARQCSIVAITRSTVNWLPLATRNYSTRARAPSNWPKPTHTVDPKPDRNP